jgi:hypothetical protein
MVQLTGLQLADQLVEGGVVVQGGQQGVGQAGPGRWPSVA